MAKKDRLLDNNAVYRDFTCGNSRFSTDVSQGFTHGDNSAKGSVFAKALATSGSYTLWLEHVVDNSGEDNQLYWLMWYDNGIPKIPMSGILTKEDLCRMSDEMNALCGRKE